MGKICSKCNNEIIGTPKFCRKCGASKEYFIEDRPQEELSFCPECGHKCEALDMFCPECGYKLNEESNQIDEWNNNDSINDEWNSDIELDIKDDWGTALKNLKNFEEDDNLKEFEYKKNTKGEVTITKVKDEYALIINVPSGVTVIGNSAFEGSSAIKITLPNGITTIGKRAFANCSNLKELIVPSSVIMIGDEAFKDSPNLDVSIPSNVMIIGKDITKGTLTEINNLNKENENIKNKYAKGLDLVKEGKYNEAIPLLEIGVNNNIVDTIVSSAYCYEKINILSKAIAYYEKAANMNNPEANYKLGVFYLEGNGVDKNVDSAIKYFKKAAMDGNLDSIINLSKIYKEGKYVDASDEEAYKWIEKAYKLSPNDEMTILLYSKYLFDGCGVKQDYHQAFKLLKSISHKNNEALSIVALCYKDGKGVSKNLDEAIKIYESLKQYNELGLLYLNGIGVAKDEKRATSYFERAAYSKDNFDALINAGDSYLYGRGVDKNSHIALRFYCDALKLNKTADLCCKIGLCEWMFDVKEKYFKEAIELGSVDALYYLGCIYDRLAKVPYGGTNPMTESEQKNNALIYFRKAAQKGHLDGCRWFFIMYQGYVHNEEYKKKYNITMECSFEEAFKYIHYAAEKNHIDALWDLCGAYGYGHSKGIEIDKTKAFYYLKKATDEKMKKNYPMWHQDELIKWYFEGIGTPKDINKAYELSKKCYEHGDIGNYALYVIGMCYYYGYAGLSVNKIEAINYFSKSAENDSSGPAAKFLKELKLM